MIPALIAVGRAALAGGGAARAAGVASRGAKAKAALPKAVPLNSKGQAVAKPADPTKGVSQTPQEGGINVDQVTDALKGGAIGMAKAVGEYAKQMFMQVATAVTKYFDPARLLGAALTAPTSGSKQADSAFSLLASTIGMIFLPIFLLVSAALITFAGMAKDELLPVMNEFAKGAIPAAITAFDRLTNFIHLNIKAFGMLQDFVMRLAKLQPGYWLGKAAIKEAGGIAENAASMFDSKNYRKESGNEEGEEEDKDREKTPGEKFAASLKIAFLAYRQQQQGGTGQSTTLEDVTKNIQLAAVNSNPFEIELLKTNREILAVAEAAFSDFGKPKPKSGGQL